MKRLFVLLCCVASLAAGLVACGKSEADQKMADDIAKIREIKEKEQADLGKRDRDQKDYKEQVKKAAAAPLREIK
jgi:hypothetical protein